MSKRSKKAETKKSVDGLSRREFIRNAGIIAGGAAVVGAVGCTPAEAPKPWIPAKWDYEADVVVVGFGAAGLTSAITAHDAGAKVLMLEKNPKGKEGGNSRVSGNIVLAPKPENLETFTKYLNNCDYWGQLPDEVANAAAEEMVKNQEWLESMGCTLKEYNWGAEVLVPGGESVRSVIGKGVGYQGVWSQIVGNIEQRKIPVLYETPGKRLIKTYDGEIVGIVADQAGKEVYIKANRGVVLTTGGYEYNQQMQKGFAPAYPIQYAGNPANTGDGVIMAEAVGADIRNMNNVMGAIFGGIKVPGHESVLLPTFGALMAFYTGKPMNGFMYVDKFGKRFVNEYKDTRHGWGWREVLYFNAEEMTYPMIPWYGIFDNKGRTMGPMVIPNQFLGWSSIIDGYEWSKDNLAEIDKGYILKADSIKELAQKIQKLKNNDNKMNSDNLEKTVNKFNEYCKNGNDLDFGRPSKNLEPLDTPPFYAMEVWGTSVNTQGGPRRDEKARIVDVFGKPIPRLYSAGELGSIWVSLYQGTGNLGECFAFGRIAGRNAAAMAPWK